MKSKEIKLGELIKNFDKKRIPLSSRQRIERKGKYPYYGATSIVDYVDDYIFDGDYILMGEDGTVVDDCGYPILQVVKGKFWCNNHAHVIRNTELVTFEYLYYLLKNTNVRSIVTGAVQPKISQSNMNNLCVFIHEDVDEQRKITSILSKLDDKIETNTAINKNLEEQAQALFNNAIHQSTSITYESMDSLAEVKGGKRLPKGITLLDKPNSHPYIRVSNLSNEPYVSLSSNFGYVDDETQKLISRYVVLEGDVIISIVGTIGLNAIVDESLNNANLTENCVKLTNLKHVTPEYLLMYLRNPIGSENIKRGTVGAVQLKLPIKNIQALSVPILPKDEMVQLEKSLSLILNKVSVNIIESKKLASIRDTLLPRLMSGEIDVSDIEI